MTQRIFWECKVEIRIFISQERGLAHRTALLFPRATSQTDTLARPFGDCREGQKPRGKQRGV